MLSRRKYRQTTKTVNGVQVLVDHNHKNRLTLDLKNKTLTLTVIATGVNTILTSILTQPSLVKRDLLTQYDAILAPHSIAIINRTPKRYI